jgi:hypothetical protein
MQRLKNKIAVVESDDTAGDAIAKARAKVGGEAKWRLVCGS